MEKRVTRYCGVFLCLCLTTAFSATIPDRDSVLSVVEKVVYKQNHELSWRGLPITGV